MSRLFPQMMLSSASLLKDPTVQRSSKFSTSNATKLVYEHEPSMTRQSQTQFKSKFMNEQQYQTQYKSEFMKEHLLAANPKVAEVSKSSSSEIKQGMTEKKKTTKVVLQNNTELKSDGLKKFSKNVKHNLRLRKKSAGNERRCIIAEPGSKAVENSECRDNSDPTSPKEVDLVLRAQVPFFWRSHPNVVTISSSVAKKCKRKDLPVLREVLKTNMKEGNLRTCRVHFPHQQQSIADIGSISCLSLSSWENFSVAYPAY